MEHNVLHLEKFKLLHFVLFLYHFNSIVFVTRLHFRPKTPPPIKEESTCVLDDTIFSPTSTVPITIELQNLTSDQPTSLLDDTLFTTSPFTLNDLYSDTVEFDDTRQVSLVDPVLNRTFGCSKFNVVSDCVSVNSVYEQCETNKKHSILSSTLTSPKYNSVNVMPSASWPTQPKIVNHVSNGPLSYSDGKNYSHLIILISIFI